MLAHRQRHVRLVAVADFDGRRALARVTHARIVAGAANRDRGILRQFAIQPVRCVDVGEVVRGSPLAGWYETDRANRRIVNRECEVALGRTLRMGFGASGLLDSDRRRQQHQQLLQRGVVGDADLPDGGQVGQQHRQRRFDLVEEPRRLVRRFGTVSQQGAKL